MNYGKLLSWSPEKGQADAALLATVNVEPSMTVQSQAEEADINVIMRRFGVTGQLPQVQMPPSYGDFTGVSDYRDALHLVRAADDAFLQLDVKVRNRFDNDPARFLDWVEDPARTREELEEAGLAVPKAVPEPLIVPPAPVPPA